MKQYAVIHAVAGLFEGYSDTTCEFFPKRGFADKHIIQILNDYRKDEMCVNIDLLTTTRPMSPSLVSTRTTTLASHQTWSTTIGWQRTETTCSVEVFRIIEIDMSNRSGSTESCWLTWDQQDTTQAWDYYPLCMSLVARVSSDVMDNTGKYTCHETNMYQLTEFISSVYYRNHAFIDMDDYTMHAFRIPKPKNNDEETTA